MNGGKAVAEEAENCEEEVFSDCNTGGLCLKVHHRTYVVGNLPSTKRFFRRCAHMFCEGGCPRSAIRLNRSRARQGLAPTGDDRVLSAVRVKRLILFPPATIDLHDFVDTRAFESGLEHLRMRLLALQGQPSIRFFFYLHFVLPVSSSSLQPHIQLILSNCHLAKFSVHRRLRRRYVTTSRSRHRCLRFALADR